MSFYKNIGDTEVRARQMSQTIYKYYKKKAIDGFCSQITRISVILDTSGRYHPINISNDFITNRQKLIEIKSTMDPLRTPLLFFYPSLYAELTQYMAKMSPYIKTSYHRYNEVMIEAYLYMGYQVTVWDIFGIPHIFSL